MAWAKNGTPSTLTGAADVITISDLTANKFNIFLSHLIASGEILGELRFDNISTSTYATRFSDNGGADTTIISQDDIVWRWGTSGENMFNIGYGVNITGEEKLVIGFLMTNQTAGAGTAPNRREIVGKATQSAQYTRLDIVNLGTGDFTTGSNVSAIGTN